MGTPRAELTGKVAIVTGAARGIGFAIARRFAAEGASVALSDIDVAGVQAAVTAFAEIPKPVVAAVTGYALGGGCELALAADFRVAAEDATFGQPETLLGIIPGAGGTQRLARLIGPSKAKDLIFSGRFVKADEALAIGLADRLVPAASVYEEALAWASQYVKAAPYALAAAKTSTSAPRGSPRTRMCGAATTATPLPP